MFCCFFSISLLILTLDDNDYTLLVYQLILVVIFFEGKELSTFNKHPRLKTLLSLRQFQ